MFKWLRNIRQKRLAAKRIARLEFLDGRLEYAAQIENVGLLRRTLNRLPMVYHVYTFNGLATSYTSVKMSDGYEIEASGSSECDTLRDAVEKVVDRLRVTWIL